MEALKQKIILFLHWSQKYTKTDMVYIVKGGSWLTAKKLGMAVISLVTMVAFANWLSQETYGGYQYILAMAGLVTIFSLPGLKIALIRSIARGQEGTLKAVFKTRLYWGLLGGAILAGGAGWYFINGNSTLGWSFLVIALLTPIYQAAGIYISYWNGRKNFSTTTKYSLVSEILSAVIIILTIYLTDNIIYIILATFGSWSLFSYIFYHLTKAKLKNNQIDQEAIPYGKSLTIMTSIGMIATHIDKVILWQFLGAGQVAIYAFAQKPIDKALSFLPINILALPKLSEKNIDAARKKGVVSKFWRLMIPAVLMTIGAIVFAELAYQIIFPQYSESVKYFQVLSLLFLAKPFILFSASLTVMMKKREQYIISFLTHPLKIILFLALIPAFGLWGAVTALLAGQAANSALTTYFFWKM